MVTECICVCLYVFFVYVFFADVAGEGGGEPQTCGYKMSHGDEKFSLGSVVGDTVVTLCGDRRRLPLPWGAFCIKIANHCRVHLKQVVCVS